MKRQATAPREDGERQSLREIKGIVSDYLGQGGHWKDLMWQLGLEQRVVYEGDGKRGGRFSHFARKVCSTKGLYSSVLKRRITAYEIQEAVDTILALSKAIPKTRFDNGDLLYKWAQVNKMIRGFAGRLNEVEKMNRCLYEEESNPEDRRNLASTLKDPLLIHLLFTQEADEEVLEAIAENINTPQVVLAELAKFGSVKVRVEIAINENTPFEILKILALDEREDAEIRIAAIENKNFLPEELKSLKRLHSDPVVVEAVTDKMGM